MTSPCRGWVVTALLALALSACESTRGEDAASEVCLPRTLYVTSVDGRGADLAAGAWRVEAMEDAVRLRGGARPDVVEVRAAPIEHGERVSRPTAAVVEEGPDSVHLLLLEPGGIGRDALGTWSGPKTSGNERTVPLTVVGLRSLLDRRVASPAPEERFLRSVAVAGPSALPKEDALAPLAILLAKDDPAAGACWSGILASGVPAGHLRRAFHLALVRLSPEVSDALGELAARERAGSDADDRMSVLAYDRLAALLAAAGRPVSSWLTRFVELEAVSPPAK